MSATPLTPATMKRGGRYNWIGQPERLEYAGKQGAWHQFVRVGGFKVWCEVRDADLSMMEETPSYDDQSL